MVLHALQLQTPTASALKISAKMKSLFIVALNLSLYNYISLIGIPRVPAALQGSELSVSVHRWD